MENPDLTSVVRQVLLQRWDPLVVGNNPKLSDEYDNLILRLVDLITRHMPPDAIEEALFDHEYDLGLDMTTGQEQRRSTALALASLYTSS
jgi:hypothetical protein